MIVTSEDVLRQPSSDVSLEEGKKIAKQLAAQLEKSDIGVGLSAPQVGILARVFVVKSQSGIKAFVNPKILEKREPFINQGEGCLSFPGLWINTIRYHSITIEDDLHGTTEINHFGAVVAQHEADHLDGVLFLDRKVPGRYESCFCGSEKKFKFCCNSKVR